MTISAAFRVLETTIEDIHGAYKAGQLTARQLVQTYLDRIDAYNKQGPAINAIISLNPTALEEADRLDAAFKASGFVGPLHGIPIIIKDQADAKGMPTTLGSVLFNDYYPDRDAFVVAKLKKAGAIILAKATLGELGGGDTHGSLFGSTRNPYDPERTAGGSSGGSGVSVAANFCAVGVGQEGFASIRRPSTLELDRRNASNGRPCEPRRSLCGLAFYCGISRPHVPYCYRFDKALGRHCRLRRLRPRRPSYGQRCWSYT